ncbi:MULTISPECIES: GNAT family N-acetyltransferase [unclassified Streptomyces]|uniref:GNAT family N-acetyltransferase n=1 Tax=unclassified Streptomyces TaxID=2593676 RepID=UPI0038062C70
MLALPGGPEPRPWRVSDADALVAADRDPAIRHWNRLPVETPEDARRRIEHLHALVRGDVRSCTAPSRLAAGYGPRRVRPAGDPAAR